MAVMAFSEHIDVADTQEWLNRLKTFLTAQLWTINFHEENVAWTNLGGGVWGFAAGDEHFLDFESNGYGSQTIHIRIRISGDTGGVSRTITMNIGYGDPTLDTTSGSNPDIRFKNPVSGFFENLPFSTSTITDLVSKLSLPRMYIFGFEQKYCCIVNKLDQQKVSYIHFGTLEMHDANSIFGSFTVGRGVENWQTAVHDTPFDVNNYISYYRRTTPPSGGSTNSENKHNISNPGTNSPHLEVMSTTNAFHGQSRFFVIKNFISELRPLVRQYHYVIDPGDSRWQYVARHFAYRTNVIGFRIGERFNISSEEYIAFPNNQIDLSRFGVAFRIL